MSRLGERMSRNKKIVIGVGDRHRAGAIAYANVRFKRRTGIEVTTETMQKRRARSDRVRVGQDPAEARRQHQRRHDGTGHRSRGRRRRPRHEGTVPAADRSAQPADGGASGRRRRSRRRDRRSSSCGSSIESAKVALKQAEDNYNRQQNLWKGGLTTRETLERAENDLKLRQADLRSQEQQLARSSCGWKRRARRPRARATI